MVELAHSASSGTTESSFEKRGCSIGLFRAVRDLAVERDATPGAWSIGAVSALLLGNHEILKAGNRWEKRADPFRTLTHPSRSSLIDLLQEEHRSSKHPLLDVCYEGHVANANLFVSFAYAADFVELVDALECYLEGEGEGAEETTFFWFDLFVNNQWAALDRDFDWWATTFRTAINDIGKTVLVLLPWHAPIPLTRVWCLFEIYCSSNLSVALSRTQLVAFHEQLVSDFEGIQMALSKIDLEKSTSYLPDDRERVFAVVRGFPGGFSHFNQKVLGILRDWIAEAARKTLPAAAESADNEALENSFRFAQILADRGDLVEAKALYESILAGFLSLHGPGHNRVLLTMNQLAILLMAMGRLPEAKALLEEALRLHEQGTSADAHGSSKESMLNAASNLGAVFFRTRDLASCEVLWEKCVRGYLEVFGPRHPRTLKAINNFAAVEFELKNYDKAKDAFEMALEGKEEQLGMNHPDTLSSVVGLASVLEHFGRTQEALALSERAAKGYSEQLGPSHPHALAAAKQVAFLARRVAEAAAAPQSVSSGSAGSAGHGRAVVPWPQLQLQQNKADTSSQLAKKDGDKSLALLEFSEAVAHYSRALAQQCPESHDGQGADDEDEFTAQVLCRRASAHLGLGQLLPALDDCTCAVELRESYGDALQVRVRVLRALGREAEALEDERRVDFIEAVKQCQEIEASAGDYPDSLKVGSHPHVLKRLPFVYPQNKGSYSCDVCFNFGFGWVFTCQECNYDCHPFCAIANAKNDGAIASGDESITSRLV